MQIEREQPFCHSIFTILEGSVAGSVFSQLGLGQHH
jgi:hypothetical protein